jgi:lipopolysaccharide/colanic/teichoic acid biosynthesis glycosyltransferase
MPEKLQYDFYYVKNQGLLLDLMIIAWTVRTILSGAGR